MKHYKTAAMIGICAALLTGCAALWNQAEAGSVGIIGGADGPTVIFTTGRLSPAGWGVIAIFLAVVIVGIVLLVRRLRK